MTAVIVICGVLLFFLILLLCPVHIYADFENELGARIRYLFFTYKIAPTPQKVEPKEEKRPKEKKEQAAGNDAKSRIRGILEQKGLSGFLSILREFASMATGTAKKVFSHMVIDSISVDVAVGDEDAAQTAILFGGICAAVYTPMGMLVNNLKCKQYHINIVPNFQAKTCKIRFHFKAHILLLFLVASSLSALFQSMKIFKAIKQTPEN